MQVYNNYKSPAFGIKTSPIQNKEQRQPLTREEGEKLLTPKFNAMATFATGLVMYPLSHETIKNTPLKNPLTALGVLSTVSALVYAGTHYIKKADAMATDQITNEIKQKNPEEYTEFMYKVAHNTLTEKDIKKSCDSYPLMKRDFLAVALIPKLIVTDIANGIKSLTKKD